MRPAWHDLLAPLPPDAVVRRKPIATPGWHQLSLELLDAAAGLRHLMVVLDEKDNPVAASDWVMIRADHERVRYVHENLAVRFKPRGRHSGARWRTVSAAAPGSATTRATESTRSALKVAEVAAIRKLVEEIMARARR